MLSGDNGILQKATTAKENTERAEIVENAKIDVLNEITGNKGNDLQESQLKSVLETYFIKSEIPEELPSDLSTLELTTLNNKYKIKVSEIYDGKFKTSPKEPKLARNELRANPSAENDYEKSSYVNYTDASGNTILCRVLYSDDNGIDIISADVIKNEGTVLTVPLGSGDTNENVTATAFTYTGSGTMNNDAKKAAASYNRAFTTLNEIAESYRNKTDGIAESARCVGSPRDTTIDTTDSSEYFTGTYTYLTKYSWNGIFKDVDTNYITDFNQMENIEINIASSTYWLASRIVISDSSTTRFNIRAVDTSGRWSSYDLFRAESYGRCNKSNAWTIGYRPVFHLNSDVKILSGEGTIDSPYELGI